MSFYVDMVWELINSTFFIWIRDIFSRFTFVTDSKNSNLDVCMDYVYHQDSKGILIRNAFKKIPQVIVKKMPSHEHLKCVQLL